MSDGHQRAARNRRELDRHVRHLVGGKIRIAPGKCEPGGRIPHVHAANLEYELAILAVDGFEQPTANVWFEAYEAGAPSRVAEFRPAPPPAIDFAREDFKRDRGRHRDANADPYRIAAHGLGLCTRLDRSVCCLNARSCSSHSFSICPSQSRTGPKAVGSSRYTRTRASASIPSSTTSRALRSTRKWRLSAGGLLFMVRASSPARRGLARSA